MEPWNPFNAFQALSMALGIEVNAVLGSMLPFGPWTRFSTGQGMEGGVGPCRAWVALSRFAVLDAFSALFWDGTSFSYVNAFLTGYRG